MEMAKNNLMVSFNPLVYNWLQLCAIEFLQLLHKPIKVGSF